MKPIFHRVLRRIVKYLGIAIILISVFIFGDKGGSERVKDQVFENWPNLPNCKLTTVARYPSEDDAHLAIVLKRDCAIGEFIDYFVRVQFPGGGWDLVELENDHYPVRDPEIVWVKKNTLQITVSTRTLSGTLVHHAGKDIEIIRVYQPREPGAFPN